MSDTPGAEGIEGCELTNVGVVTELRSSARAVHFLNSQTTSAVSVFSLHFPHWKHCTQIYYISICVFVFVKIVNAYKIFFFPEILVGLLNLG